ncbi:acetyl-CoA carboxylase carboxyl transferase subunit alpha, partial [Acinetobacter baumannii]|nr:acetyl-CoA carboxylase carboxyl transferase subunit alpha [Acinetobacter baumannii]
IYSVISPEGCASILWKTAEKAEQASEALALTAEKLQQMGIVEYVVDEGEGAHLQPEKVMQDLKAVLKQALEELQPMDAQERCEARYQRLMKFGSDNLGLAS